MFICDEKVQHLKNRGKRVLLADKNERLSLQQSVKGSTEGQAARINIILAVLSQITRFRKMMSRGIGGGGIIFK